MKNFSFLCLLSFVFCLSSNGQTRLPLADPFVMWHGDKYYAYGTSDNNGIVVYTSDDLRFWTKQPNLALHKSNSYADRWFWAPEVYFVNGQFYMYYSADEHICVATSNSPLGPFVQSVQEPMWADKAIDHSLFIDDNGKAYLFFVRFTDGNVVWVAELENDLKTIKTSTVRQCFSVNTSGWEADLGKVNEGPFCIKHNGVYYLTFSANDYRSQNYGVGYATASNIMGIWNKSTNNPVLRKPNGLFGTGHHCLFRDKNNNLKMAFHAHHSETTVAPREMYITDVSFTTPDRGIPALKVSSNYFPTYVLNSAFGGNETPLMGWSSWNANRVHINEALIKETADSIVSLSLKNYGYKWVNIDDGFFNGRNAQGVLQVNSKFPNGMKVVSNYIHGKGLKAGIYSDAGKNTCASLNEGDASGRNSCLYGHEEQDLRLFFDTWNYDFIKVDYCGGIELGLNEKTAYTNIGNIIQNLKIELNRDLHYNICRWSFPGTWAASVADSWRISGDIWDNFSSIAEIIDLNTYLAPYCSKGHFNDMDMLQVGRGLSVEEEKTHFAMWSIMTSPLVIGCNFRNIRPSTVEILKNAEIIAVNQDSLCLQAEVVAANGKTKVFAKTIEQRHGKVRAVALYNPTYTTKNIRVNFKDIHLSPKARVRDLWQHADLGEFTDFYETQVPAHGTAMLRIEGDAAIDKLRYQGEYAFMNKFAAINVSQNARFSKITHFTNSGGAIMEWLGNSAENYAEYRDVYVKNGGNYTFKLYYISAENRNLQVIVNGVTYTMTNLNSGGWSNRATAQIQIQLNAGSNVIRLANPIAFAPNIDKFELIPEGATEETDPFDFDPNNQVDEDAALPKTSTEADEYWYYILFKENEFVLQDVGENEFLLTKYLDENEEAQKWKIVETGDRGEFKYHIISNDGRSLQRVQTSETTDGFYKTTSDETKWERFRIVATTHNGLKPAWEIERNGANNRRLNQYNPTQVYGENKKISEWEANDHGNPVIFVPAGTTHSAVENQQTKVKVRISIDKNRLTVEGQNIETVSLFTFTGSLAQRKTAEPFSFHIALQGCYLALIQYTNNVKEAVKVVI